MAKKKNENEVVVKIEGKAWKEAVDKAFAKKVKDITVPGFRKGKVPREIYDRTILIMLHHTAIHIIIFARFSLPPSNLCKIKCIKVNTAKITKA